MNIIESKHQSMVEMLYIAPIRKEIKIERRLDVQNAKLFKVFN